VQFEKSRKSTKLTTFFLPGTVYKILSEAAVTNSTTMKSIVMQALNVDFLDDLLSADPGTASGFVGQVFAGMDAVKGCQSQLRLYDTSCCRYLQNYGSEGGCHFAIRAPVEWLQLLREVSQKYAIPMVNIITIVLILTGPFLTGSTPESR
jgi:hypothetical protein